MNKWKAMFWIGLILGVALYAWTLWGATSGR
jgi:hypothetical protein